jgi:MFS family permease
LRELLVSGVVDSFGMALGWTVFVLLATARGGLAEAALYNAAMLAGVVLSAPVTGWLSRRVGGRTLLRGAAGIEFVLRLACSAGSSPACRPG